MSVENKPPFSEEINNIINDLKTYINLRIQLIQLNVIEKISVALSNMISVGAALLFFILFFIFGSFALSYLIGNYFENDAVGFGIIAGFYLLVALVLMIVGKKQIRNKLINKFIDQLTNEEDERK